MLIRTNTETGGNGAGAPPKGTQETAGALNMGLQASSAFVLLFQFLAYVVPIFGGWWADVKVGRYYAIVVGVLICGVAHIIQIIGAIPAVLQQGTAHAAPPFILGLIILAFGAGIFKPNIAPTVLDQQLKSKEFVKTLKSGERVSLPLGLVQDLILRPLCPWAKRIEMFIRLLSPPS